MVAKRLGMMVVAAALLASPALAQLARGLGKPLTEAEARGALLGVEMQGYTPTGGFDWRECIQPNGETLYETPDHILKGRLLITPGGEACFAYEDDGYTDLGCFVVHKTAGGLRFQTEGPAPVVFLATRIITGVKTCQPRDLVG